MKNISTRIKKIVREILEEKGLKCEHLREDQVLYESGLGLDSMDTAALSAALEQEFGNDPFMAGKFPKTISDIIEFYAVDLKK